MGEGDVVMFGDEGVGEVGLEEAAPGLAVIGLGADEEAIAGGGEAIERVEGVEVGGGGRADVDIAAFGEADFAARILAEGAQEVGFAAAQVDGEAVAELDLFGGRAPGAGLQLAAQGLAGGMRTLVGAAGQAGGYGQVGVNF